MGSELEESEIAGKNIFMNFFYGNKIMKFNKKILFVSLRGFRRNFSTFLLSQKIKAKK